MKSRRDGKIERTNALPIRALTATLVLALASTGCGTERTGESDIEVELTGRYAGAPVVLISLDTLRSDYLPVYGYDGIETPALDRLAKDGLVFDSAWSHYPLTVPSHASILTGALPTEHGVRDNVGYPLRSDEFHYLPRLLREAGYRTAGAVSTFLLAGDAGFGDGFELYDDQIARDLERSLAASQRSGDETLDRLLPWLAEAHDEPFFLFFHLYEPHTPYDPPEPFASRYDDPYAGEVAHADAIVGRLLAELDRLGVYDRSLIVALSDHGEGLGDHGEAEHGVLLYREALQIPLIVKLPADDGVRTGERVAKPAQLIDVAPTIRALVGVEPPQDGSVPLLDLRRPDAPNRRIYAETYYPRLRLGWSELTSAIEDRFYLIDGPDPELFDLTTDPGQTRNVLLDNRRDYAALDSWLEQQVADLTAPSAVDEETQSRLASLGYLSSSAAVGDGPLPDPKSRIHVLTDLAEAFQLQGRGRHAEAVESFRRVVNDNAGLADGLEGMATSLHALGRLDEAIDAYQQAMTASGGADRVALNLARVFLEAGRLDDAVAHAELALPTRPPEANLILARVALRDERPEGAIELGRTALASRPGDVSAHILLAEALILTGDLDAASREVTAANAARDAQSGDVTPTDFFFVQGELAAQQGQGEDAVRFFLQEIQKNPGNLRAYTRLAFLYAFFDQPAQATAALRQMVDANPRPSAYGAAVEALRALGDEGQASRLLDYARRQFPQDVTLQEL
ncbi:MAG: sulfatase-like hydrolase/transferase [Thermoanaerobaculia bacterium]|nr:sulfatase-like hydrolase/transferase [Thermoanaerobaculia bacterium]